MKNSLVATVLFMGLVGLSARVFAESPATGPVVSSDDAAINILIQNQEQALIAQEAKVSDLIAGNDSVARQIKSAKIKRLVAEVGAVASVAIVVGGVWFARTFGGAGEWANLTKIGYVTAAFGAGTSVGTVIYLSLTWDQAEKLLAELEKDKIKLAAERDDLAAKKAELIEIKARLHR